MPQELWHLPRSQWIAPRLFVRSVRHDWQGGAYSQTIEASVYQRPYARA